MAPFIYPSDYQYMMGTPGSAGDGDGDKGKPRKKPEEKRDLQLLRMQSRETGEVVPQAELSFAKSWNHFFAGG